MVHRLSHYYLPRATDHPALLEFHLLRRLPTYRLAPPVSTAFPGCLLIGAAPDDACMFRSRISFAFEIPAMEIVDGRGPTYWDVIGFITVFGAIRTVS